MSNRIHIVTGGGTGIGAATAVELARREQQVVILGRRVEPLQETAANDPQRIHTLALDVSEQTAGERLRAWLQDRQLRPCSLTHNAAILDPVTALGQIEADAWRRHFEINLHAPLLLTQALLDLLCPGGRQLLISSGAAYSPIAGWAAYCASKAALHMLMQQFASEFRAEQLATADLRPGVVDTPMQAAIRASDEQDFPAVDRFRELKDNDELVKPADVGCMIAGLLTRHENADFHGESWDMRNPDHLSRWTGP